VVRRHVRFELLDVTLGDQPIGRATIDSWESADGGDQWSARVLLKAGHGAQDGLLSGATRDGRTLSGEVRIADGQEGPRGARSVLVEMHGIGPLVETPPEA